jgi:hypothetical protein
MEFAEAVFAFEKLAGDPIDTKKCAVESSQRRVDERITPPSEENTDEIIQYNQEQRFAAVNFTGPGEMHCPRSALGAGVRLLCCADSDANLFTDGACQYSTYVLQTHELVPMLTSGPPLDIQECNHIVETVTQEFADYITSVDTEFDHHINERAIRQQKMEFEASKHVDVNASENPPKSIRGECAETTICSQCSPFFVISFIPRCSRGSSVDYSQPLLAVFGSFEKEEDAMRYAKDVLCMRYSKLQLLVVEGGKWLYPRVLNDEDALKIANFYPNAPNLESIINAHTKR